MLLSLYDQNPALLWLAVAALFATLELATGTGRLLGPALAAFVPAALASLQVAEPVAVVAFGMFALGALLLTDEALAPGLRTARVRLPERKPRTRPAATALARVGAPEPDAAAPEAPRPEVEAFKPEPVAPTILAEPAPLPAPVSEPAETVAPADRVEPEPSTPVVAAPVPATPTVAPVTAPPAKSRRGRAAQPVVPDATRSRQLIGGVGRTSGEFLNGVGRVWIGGAEWGAELDHGEELEPDRPVEVVGVLGGVTLRVRPVPEAA